MKKIFFSILLIVLIFASPLGAYYSQLTKAQVEEAIRLGKLYQGNLHILFNNLLFRGQNPSQLDLQVFTPYNQIVILSAINQASSIDSPSVQQVLTNPKILFFVYPRTAADFPRQSYLEVTGDYFSRYLMGTAGVANNFERTIYNKILQSGLNPSQIYQFPTSQIAPLAQVNFYQPQKEEKGKEQNPWLLPLDFSELE